MIARLLGRLGKSVTALQMKSELKLAQRFVGKTPLAEVGQAHGSAVVVVPHPFAKLLEREGIEREHALAAVAHRVLFGGGFFFLDLDLVLFGEPAQGVGVRQLLVLHQKRYDRAPFARREALKNALGRNDIKRRRLLLSEGT